MTQKLSVGQCATLACLLEVSAPKVGNVNRSVDFTDTTFYDFAASAAAIGPVFDRAGQLSTCELILEAVRTTRSVCDSNTNLGIILLLAPLVNIPPDVPLANGIESVLNAVSKEDSRPAFEAINLAAPGGMGKVDQADVHDVPNIDLISAMELARDRDKIAWQYCENFSDVFERVVPGLVDTLNSGHSLPDAIVHAHVRLISEIGDTLIARKCGTAVSENARQMAARVIGHPIGSADYLSRLSDFDFWLRSDANRRNPGTCADLITAGLFVAMREELIERPFRFRNPSCL